MTKLINLSFSAKPTCWTIISCQTQSLLSSETSILAIVASCTVCALGWWAQTCGIGVSPCRTSSRGICAWETKTVSSWMFILKRIESKNYNVNCYKINIGEHIWRPMELNNVLEKTLLFGKKQDLLWISRSAKCGCGKKWMEKKKEHNVITHSTNKS